MHLPTKYLDSLQNKNPFTEVSKIVCTFLKCNGDKVSTLSIVSGDETAYLTNAAWGLWIHRVKSEEGLKGFWKESLRKQWPPERLNFTFQGDILVAQISVVQKDYFVWETERDDCQNRGEEWEWADKGCHSA